LEKAKSGDRDALEALCEKIRVRLRPVIQYRLCGRPQEDLEDILQDTLVIFVEKWAVIHSNPLQFALSILRNKIGDALRAQSGTRDTSLYRDGSRHAAREMSLGEHDPEIADAGSSFFDDISAADLRPHIVQAIKKLTKFCQVYFLAVLEDRELGEVWQFAKAFEPSLTRCTFDQRTRRCREKLRQLVSPFV